MSDQPTNPPTDDDFAAQAEGKQPGLLREFWDFLRTNRKWWLIPIVVLLFLLGVLVLAKPVIAPFIYTIF